MAHKQLPRNEDGSLQAFAWPGGFTIAYQDGDGETLCATCAKEAEQDDIPQGRPESYFILEGGEEDACTQCDVILK